jgi:hypothetical protein
MVEIPHALYFLFDVFDEVGFLGELFLIDAFDRVDLVLCRLEFYLLDGEDEGEGTLAQSAQGMEVVPFEDLAALLDGLFLLHHYRIIRKIRPLLFTPTRLFSVFQHYKGCQITAKNTWHSSGGKWPSGLGGITWGAGVAGVWTGKIEKTEASGL